MPCLGVYTVKLWRRTCFEGLDIQSLKVSIVIKNNQIQADSVYRYTFAEAFGIKIQYLLHVENTFIGSLSTVFFKIQPLNVLKRSFIILMSINTVTNGTQAFEKLCDANSLIILF